MKLLPYSAIDGIATFPDSFIRGLFGRMQEEGLADIVFYDGEATNADDFLRIMKFQSNMLTVIEFQGEIAGLYWLNNFEQRKAEFHFCFFENLRGGSALQAGEKIRSALFSMKDKDGEPLFDLFYGLTEVENKPAQKWCERMGFEFLGILPSALWNARLQKSVPANYWYVERGKGKNG